MQFAGDAVKEVLAHARVLSVTTRLRCCDTRLCVGVQSAGPYIQGRAAHTSVMTNLRVL